MQTEQYKITGKELILTIANDGELYKQFLEACAIRFTTGKWYIAAIIVKAKHNIAKFYDAVDIDAKAISEAKAYLEYRYHSHFILEYLPFYLESAKNTANTYLETH